MIWSSTETRVIINEQESFRFNKVVINSSGIVGVLSVFHLCENASLLIWFQGTKIYCIALVYINQQCVIETNRFSHQCITYNDCGDSVETETFAKIL